MSPFSFSSSFRNRSIETGGIAYSSSDEVRAHVPDVPPLAGPGPRRRRGVRGLELAPAMGDRCCLAPGGAGRHEGGVVVIAVRLALCALVGLGVGCQGPARDRATQRAPAIRVVAPADTVPRSLNIYAAAGAGMLSPAARRAKPLVYVPNSKDGTVSVIDPRAYRVVRTFATGALPQHVVPAYDLATLWVANNLGNSLMPIDPVTGRDGRIVPVSDPYNLYFTPDGRFAVVIAERRQRLDFRDAHTLALVASVPVECRGVDHMEFTADGRYALATCEFSGQLLKLDLATRHIVGYLLLDPEGLGPRAMPQDIRSAPDGRVFYVADMMANGVFLVDPAAFRRVGFIATGKGAHGIYPSRDGRLLYVSNRGWNTVGGGRRGPGSVTVLDPATQAIVATWPVPGGARRRARARARRRRATRAGGRARPGGREPRDRGARGRRPGPRHPAQQRRPRERARQDPRGRPGRLGPDDRHQPQGIAERHPRGPAAHGGAAPRSRREHREHGRPHDIPDGERVQRHEARGAGPHRRDEPRRGGHADPGVERRPRVRGDRVLRGAVPRRQGARAGRVPGLPPARGGRRRRCDRLRGESPGAREHPRPRHRAHGAAERLRGGPGAGLSGGVAET